MTIRRPLIKVILLPPLMNLLLLISPRVALLISPPIPVSPRIPLRLNLPALISLGALPLRSLPVMINPKVPPLKNCSLLRISRFMTHPVMK